jgi:hypothetical protein
MKKSPRSSSVVKEYVQRLSDGDLSTVIDRLIQPVCGDRADVSLLFQKDKELDNWLCKSKSAEDWFDKVDLIEDTAKKELEKRQKSKEKEKSK